MEDPGPSDVRGINAWSDRRCLLMLMLLVVLMRAWQLTHTEVPARDSIGYIRIAWQLENLGWQKAVRGAPQHPGYPAILLAMSQIVQHFYPADEPLVMQLSAQLTSSLASVLLVIPMFWLGREVFDRRISFWGALFFQCIPALGRILPDGLSEGVFLLFASSAMLFAMRGLRSGSVLVFLLAGITGALAYLTRPEGMLIVGAAGLILLLQQTLPLWRRSWGRCFACGLGLSLGAALPAVPFILLIGHITTKPTPQRLIEGEKTASRLAPSVAGSPRFSSHLPLAVWWEGEDDVSPAERSVWGAKTLIRVLVRGSFHVGWLFALLACWRRRDLFVRIPGLWMQGVLVVLLALLLYRVAVQIGYLSDRHTVLILLCGVYWTAAGAVLVGEDLARWAARMAEKWPVCRYKALQSPQVVSLLLLLAFTFPAGFRSLKTLHGDREGFRAAGIWLAQHTLPGDRVLDPYCWSHYYAGRVFLEYPAKPLPCRQPPVQYVVYEKGKNAHSRLSEVKRAEALIEEGRLVHSWPVSRGEVQIYEVPAR